MAAKRKSNSCTNSMELNSTLIALKNTSKGQLKYNRTLQDSCPIEAYKLPAFHQEHAADRGEDVFRGLWKETDSSRQPQLEEDVPDGSPAKPIAPQNNPPAVSVQTVRISPQYGRSCLAIRRFEEDVLEEVKRQKVAKVMEFEAHAQALQECSRLQEQNLERNLERKLMELYSSQKEMLRQSAVETQKRLEQQRAHYLQHSEMLEAKLRDAEKKREELEKSLREREEKLHRIQEQHSKVLALGERLKSAYNNTEHKARLGEGIPAPVRLAEEVSRKADAILASAQDSVNLDALHNQLVEYTHLLENAQDSFSKQIEEAERQAAQARAAAETQAQSQQNVGPSAPAAAATPASEVTPLPGPSATAGRRAELSAAQQALRSYAKSKLCLENVEQTLQPFMSDPQNKKYVFSLKKFVNTTINAISGVSADHLKEKLQRLGVLLSGNSVMTSNGQSLSSSNAPQGPLFCTNLVAKMIVKKGEEEVTSNHESAFPLALVAVGLWADNPDFGSLLLSHLFELCPYLVPCRLLRQEGQSTQDYHSSLGYKVVDGEIEAQDKFLRRMSGLMRLYAAIMVSPHPRGQAAPHPWGIDRAWVWLARVINQDPQPDITATLIYDLLKVTGHALLPAYRTQFAKLLYALYRNYLPQIQQSGGSGGPVTRLQNFLETALQRSCSIPPPSGML